MALALPAVSWHTHGLAVAWWSTQLQRTDLTKAVQWQYSHARP